MPLQITRLGANALSALVALVLTFPVPVLAQSLRADSDLGAQWRVNSTARLISGLPPIHPGHVGFSESEAWKEHRTQMRAAWDRMNESQVVAMSSWRDSAVSRSCPVGKTLLYPFSGPDFFNAYWLFPDCETFVMFGLEHIGDVPEIEAMNERQLVRMVADVRTATTDFFGRNYFITENMAKQLRTPQLRGVVPLFMISMALLNLDILRIVPHELAPEPRAEAATKGRPLRQMKGVLIEFRTPGSEVVRKLYYFTVDATDRGVAHYPQFVTFIRSLAPTTTFIKSASYLLHGREFLQVRNALLDVSGFLVQDDSGLPYSMLVSRGWQMQLYGKYDVPIPPFKGAFQQALDRAYREQRPLTLPFTFGYQYHDYRDERSNVMVGRRPIQSAHAENETAYPRGITLRSSSRRVR